MIKIENLRFKYAQSGFELRIPDLEIEPGKKTAFVGPSGCGKTTVLNLIAGILRADAGTITVGNQEVTSLAESKRRDFRIRNIGMVFQDFELIEYLRTIDNILLPFAINRAIQLNSERKSLAKQLASAAGIGDKLRRWPRQLSRGEQQRVAICRALIADPKVILADEPTGNLDPETKLRIMELLFDQCNRMNLTLIVVTHDHGILEGFDQTIDFDQFRQNQKPCPPNGAKVAS